MKICEGKYTFWNEQRGRSAIDYIMVKRRMYEICKIMTIYEEKEVINFSDHNQIILELKLRLKSSKQDVCRNL